MPTSPLLADLPPITCAEPGSFANGVILERHPAIVRQIMDDRPCDRWQTDLLNALVQETTQGSITPLPDGVDDSAYWRASGEPHYGRAWTDAPFLWAESFFYRRLLWSLAFFLPGPWHWIDPFQPVKDRELAEEPVAALLDEIGTLEAMDDRGAFDALVRAALLGNRADLGFRMSRSGAGGAGREFDLLDDQSEPIWQYLGKRGGARLALLADNAGPEIISDLVLCDFLIHRCGASEATLHLKPTPYYVSDATAADVVSAVRRLRQGGAGAHAVGARIMADAASGRLKVRTHEFYCRPECYWSAPPELSAELSRADLVIAKGDLNYRRLVGDVECDPTIPFAAACSYFPAPLAALRVLKSDVALGLQPDVVAKLESSGGAWRTAGTCGVIQCRLP